MFQSCISIINMSLLIILLLKFNLFKNDFNLYLNHKNDFDKFYYLFLCLIIIIIFLFVIINRIILIELKINKNNHKLIKTQKYLFNIKK
jgi:hypothetical protein